jgi:hypothetical protein
MSVKKSLSAKRKTVVSLPGRLLGDVRSLIEQARSDVARSVNSALVMLYWQVGKRIREDVLKQKRAAYGNRLSLHCRDNWLLSMGADIRDETFST